MKINSSYKMNDSVSSSQSFKALPVKSIVLPEIVGDVGRYIGNNIGTPEKKVIIATTALLFRPLVDLKYAEEDKKIDTAIKSASKAIAGGLSGVTIRALFIHLTNKLIMFRGGIVKRVMESKDLTSAEIKALKREKRLVKNFASRLLLPLELEQLNADEKIKATHKLRKYNNGLGELLAVIIMAFYTNAAFDAPMTSDLQDIFSKIIKENKSPIKAISEVAQNRYKIISNWATEKKNNCKKFFNKSKQIFRIITDKTE